MSADIPISTKWTLDASGALGRIAIESVFLIKATKTHMKGTGFLLSSGHIITNEHVVRGNSSTDIIAISSIGKDIHFTNSIIDAARDLAILFPSEIIKGGLNLGDETKMNVSQMVMTWGYPLGYNGPPPLLSVGYLAGFKNTQNNSKAIKHLVVNGAFNPGNSGGPLFLAGNNEVIGVVVSKHAPMTKFQKEALGVLGQNRSGVVFTATDETGKVIKFVESQLVAEILNYFREMTQVMIGEAISSNILKEFLSEHQIKY